MAEYTFHGIHMDIDVDTNTDVDMGICLRNIP